MQDQPGKIAAQDDIAAAPQYQTRHGGQHGIGQRLLQVGQFIHPQIGMGPCRDTEAVKGLERKVVLERERRWHGMRKIFVDYRGNTQKTGCVLGPSPVVR